MIRTAGICFVSSCLLGTAFTSAQSTLSETREVMDQLSANIQSGSSFLDRPADKGVKITGQLQFRYNFNQRDDDSLQKDQTSGFHVRRAKVKVGGDVSDRWSYKISASFSRKSGTASLSSGYARYQMDNDMELKFGQFKPPFAREDLISSSKQLAADRSVTNSFFTVGRSQGIQFSNEAERFRFAAAITDGVRAAKTDFTSDDEADFGLTARVEYRIKGSKWSPFKQFTSTRESEFASMVGGAIHYQSGGESFETDDSDTTSFTADVSFLGDGWNAFAALFWSQTEPEGGSDLENSGLIVQGGYYFNSTWEAFARYDTIFSEQVDDFSTITVGVNRYLIPESHAAKITADVQYFLDAQGSSDARDSTGRGLLESDEDSQWGMRIQMQLLF